MYSNPDPMALQNPHCKLSVGDM
ncbi:hypothetical protein L203_100596 [Cryptococcus depauperatus CBS 7841]|uniref:Uncharacterized protein n=1 Tax=Cryptococcus depauperatus CBS 7841 TaxID=1295531 RepID=A0AAJ8LWD3_9TREE